MSIEFFLNNNRYELPEKGESKWAHKLSELFKVLVEQLKEKIHLGEKELITGKKTFEQNVVSTLPSAKGESGQMIRKQEIVDIENSLNLLQERNRKNKSLENNILPINGTVSFNSTCSMGGNRITNISSAEENQDVVNLEAMKIELVNKTFPIGTLMHFHLSGPTPSSDVWKLCDGTQILGEAFGEKSSELIPNLTEGYFLMGGLTAEEGGTNRFSLLEKHLPSHSHHFYHTHILGEHHTNRDGGHYHQFESGITNASLYENPSYVTRMSMKGSVLKEISFSENHTHKVKGVLDRSQEKTLWVASGVKERGDVSARVFDNRPRYFTSRIYLKVA